MSLPFFIFKSKPIIDERILLIVTFLGFRSNFSFRAKSFAKLLARTIGVQTGRIPKKSHYQSQSGRCKINLERKPSQNKFCTPIGPMQNKFGTKTFAK